MCSCLRSARCASLPTGRRGRGASPAPRPHSPLPAPTTLSFPLRRLRLTPSLLLRPPPSPSELTRAHPPTRCEHAVATWLSSYGIKQRNLGEETMAIMTSNFWTAMSLGRLAWACLSGFVTSAWPSLFANTLCCLLAGVGFAVPSHSLLWSSAMGIGLGVASSFPAVSQPPEIHDPHRNPRATPTRPPPRHPCTTPSPPRGITARPSPRAWAALRR